MKNQNNRELLKKVINEVDPFGLIDLDTPESLNEYDPEINEILKNDISKLSSEELGLLIYQIFLSFFGDDLVKDKEKYLLIGRRFNESL
jgi:hypothetical protein